MMNRFEEMWKSADDGASSPVGPLNERDRSDCEGLLEAWSIERQHSIECEILLDQSRSALARLLAESDPCSSAGKQARRALRAIDRAARLARSGGP